MPPQDISRQAAFPQEKSPDGKIPAGRKKAAVAFDFDGTLIDSGLDKGIHIMCASWIAFLENGLEDYLNQAEPEEDVRKMLAAYVKYPGAPRFQQLSAVVNSLVNADPSALDEGDLSALPLRVGEKYPGLKDVYNRVYSALNDTAAELYWKPFPVVKKILVELAESFDLYIASGVTQHLIMEDLKRHDFDAGLFMGMYGGDTAGGSDKAFLLKKIRDRGYERVLFVADSNRDLLYAREAGAAFFRIRKNGDFLRLRSELAEGMPDEQSTWTYTDGELEFFSEKTTKIIREIILPGHTEDWRGMTEIIHRED